MGAALTLFLIATLLISDVFAGAQAGGPQSPASTQGSKPGSLKTEEAGTSVEFERLRNEGFNAGYSVDYKTARERFQQMTRLAPDHPAGYVYLANNVWRETLYQSRGLSTSRYTCRACV